MAKQIAWSAVRHVLFLVLYWARPLVRLTLKMGAYLNFGLYALGLLGNPGLSPWKWTFGAASLACAAAHWWYDTLVIKLAPPGTLIGNRWR